jgi:acyl-CoA synthetase (AMP-forming)/AMP-acid ligase II
LNRLYHAFLRSAGRDPDRPAVCAGPGAPWISFKELRRRAVALAGRLDQCGVRRGDVVLAAIGNRPALFSTVLAVWSRDAVLLPVEEGAPAAEIESLCRTFFPAAILKVAAGRLLVHATGGGRGFPGAAMIRLTSGTTGAPRGVLVTDPQILADTVAIIRKTEIRRDDVTIGVVPLNHAYGFDHIVTPLFLQGTRVLLVRKALPSLLLRALRGRGPIRFPAVPYLLDLLARHPDVPRRNGLRFCLSAGAMLPKSTSVAFRQRFGVPVRTFYGASEVGGISFDDSPGADAPEGYVGTPLPGVRISIERRGNPGLPRGQGRVVVRGPAVGSGYVPEPSADLARGRFRASDLGRVDDQGGLHLVGRASSLVNVAGEKVNPAEVEKALRGLDGVADAVAMGLRDPLRGERLEAWVATRSRLGRASIREALGRRLAPHKIPRSIHLVREIPRTARGKIDRVRLLAMR